jgi:hypothetical protein
MVDRNVWDPPTPADNSDLTKKSLVVELCIYVFANSAKDEKAVRADVQGAPGILGASQIWCQDNIDIQVSHLEKLPPLPPSEPLDLNATDLARQISCPPSDAVVEQFLQIPRSGCPDIRTMSIAVFYIPGPRFQGDNVVTGCHTFTFLPDRPTDTIPDQFILLSDEANGKVLAHELGHALLTRKDGAKWINEDPDPKRNPKDPIHNTDPGNLMFPNVSDAPIISPAQTNQAKQSILMHDKELAFGFRENKNVKLGVMFENIDVHHSSDEGDDALETSWQFKVSVLRPDNSVVASQTQSWNQDPLHWWKYDLNLNFPLLEVSSDDDKLVLEVSGIDDDTFTPNDVLPGITDEWLKSVDTWGADSTNVVGGQPGEHIAHRNSEDIDYSMTYKIRVDERPKSIIFRSLC